MSVVYLVLPTVLILATTLAAIVPWGAPPGAGYVLQVMPYMMAHLFIARGKGFVPSPVVFLAGLAMDVASAGPLGFWALIYLFGVLVARQLAGGAATSRGGRLFGLVLAVFALTAAQVGLASLYQLQWIDWQAVLVGTALAGLVTLLIDVAWRDRRFERELNVTSRGAKSRASHV